MGKGQILPKCNLFYVVITRTVFITIYVSFLSFARTNRQHERVLNLTRFASMAGSQMKY